MRVLLPSLIFVLTSFLATAQPVSVKMRPLTGYYFSDTKGDRLRSGVNYFVISNKKSFEKLFGRGTRADTPQFSKEIVIMMVKPASKMESTLKFDRVSMKAGDFVEVYCAQNLNHHRVNYEMSAIAVAAIPRSPGTRKVIFYDQYMRKLETVEIDD